MPPPVPLWAAYVYAGVDSLCLAMLGMRGEEGGGGGASGARVVHAGSCWHAL